MSDTSRVPRWMAEIIYRAEIDRAPAIVAFEELSVLHDIIERGPDWNEIDQIIVTLNRPTLAEPC